MNSSRSVVIIAPHWNTPGYVGNLRISRMVRWLSEDGIHVVLVRAGLTDRRESTDSGEIITIRDPLKMHADVPESDDLNPEQSSAFAPDLIDNEKLVRVTRKPSKIRRYLSYLLLIPDPGMVWARRAMRHPMVLDACSGSDWFLASSPPESAFITASGLANHFGGQFIMDMRDGWLDEPIKPLLRSSGLQRWRERKMERKMIQQAHSILVTSGFWKSHLVARYPDAREKTTILTNAYPRDIPFDNETVKDSAGIPAAANNKLLLLYAGRIFSSRPGRQISYLLDPILEFAGKNHGKADIVFLGDLTPEEEMELNSWKERFNGSGWNINRIPGRPHHEAVAWMKKADILLLISESRSAVPAKFFDYVSSGTPVFAASPAVSSIAEFGKNINQYYGYSFENPEMGSTVFNRIMDDVCQNNVRTNRPVEFEESFLKPTFLSLFQK